MPCLRWEHPTDAGWFAAGWNEAITGLAIAALGLTRLTRPLRLTTAAALGIALGAWLLMAPMLFHYGVGEKAVPATVTDLLFGLTLIAVTIVGHVDARRAAGVESKRS